MDEFRGSELQRFLKMITFTLRYQLASMVKDSLQEYLDAFKQYEDPLPAPVPSSVISEERRRSVWKGMRGKAKQEQIALAGYLVCVYVCVKM